MDTAQIPEDTFFIDRTLNRSLQDQIQQSIVSAILGGQFPIGSRLPSTRKLAKHLSVSRITVTLSYQELVSQTYLETQTRSGFIVSPDAPIQQLARQAIDQNATTIDWNKRIPTSLANRRQIQKPVNWRNLPYPFIYGQMDTQLFNHTAWRECSRRALGRRDFDTMAGDVTSADDPMLINYIRTRTLPRRGITANPSEILVTMGAQNALWLTIQLLARKGFHAACENPGYPDIVAALGWNGAQVTTVDVDEFGLPPKNLPQGLDAVFVTPSHHSPTAATMPMARRTELLKKAEQEDFLLVEDDYDFEMSFLASPSPALKSLDKSGRVIYVGSFSKALFPGLRLGYLVGPAQFIEEARQLRALMLRHPPGYLQRTAAYFLALGHYDRLVRDLRLAFAERRKIIVNALEKANIEIAGAPNFGGTNLWIKGPAGLDSSQLAIDLLRDGVLVEPGAPFFNNLDGSTPFFRMAYSSIQTDRIEKGVALIAKRLAM